MRILFAGTPAFAATTLAALVESTHTVVAVYTQPDRKAGRGRKLRPSAVKQLALQHGLPVYQPLSLKDPDAQRQVAELQADLMVVVAYGLILPRAVLDLPRHGCINVHASLLPRWRGAAPIQRAILAGDPETGVSIMQMEAGLDTGPVLSEVRTPIYADDTGSSLHDRLAGLGAAALIDTLTKIESGDLQAQTQDEQLANYAHKLAKSEAWLDWQRPAIELERQVRAFNPWPVAQTRAAAGTIRIWAATATPAATKPPGTVIALDHEGLLVACGDGALRITRLQIPGGKPLAVSDWLNAGKRDIEVGGEVLGPPAVA